MKTLLSPPVIPGKPQPGAAALIPNTGRKIVGTPFFAEIVLYATGADEPGRFGEVIQKPLRFGCWFESARGSTHGDRFHLSMKIRGPFERLEQLVISAENDPLFPKMRPAFVITREPRGAIKKCFRHEVFIEAADDAQIAIIPALAGKRGINIAWMEIRRIDAPFSGQIVAAEFRLCTELMLDVQPDQIGQFSQFKGDLVELMDHDELIRIWGPIREDKPGERPWWKSTRSRI